MHHIEYAPHDMIYITNTDLFQSGAVPSINACERAIKHIKNQAGKTPSSLFE
jgi:hypothetical protein